MEVPAWIFFSFWTVTGVVTLFLGFNAFDRTDLHGSVSPIAISVFKHAFVISSCHSATYALIFRPHLKIAVEKYYLWASFSAAPVVFNRVAGEHLSWYCFPVYAFINHCSLQYYFIPRSYEFDMRKRCIGYALFILTSIWSRGDAFSSYGYLSTGNLLILLLADMAAAPGDYEGIFIHLGSVAALLVLGGKMTYFPILVLPVAFVIAVYTAALVGDERFRDWLPSATVQGNRRLRDLKKTLQKHGKMIEFAIGMFGTILFQNFFRLTSFDDVVVFIYFAVAWLSNLALMMCSRDLGILNFLLGNVVVGCTVSQFGLRGTTWIAYGASLLLYLVRLRLESLVLVDRGGEKSAIIVWRDSLVQDEEDESGEDESGEVELQVRQTDPNYIIHQLELEVRTRDDDEGVEERNGLNYQRSESEIIGPAIKFQGLN